MADDKGEQPITISQGSGDGVTIDPQNPLPEGSFFYRRLFAAVIGFNALVFVWVAAYWLHSGGWHDQVFSLTKLMVYAAGVILTYYFVAPSASELTNMIATASLMKHSLTTAAQTAIGTPGLGAGAPKQSFVAPDSQIPASGPGEAPMGLSGDVDNSADEDVAPRGQP